ncbi:hypothetical protein HYN48_12725 [Flavobacterium magnum]|uniref:Lipocalin-like domain-containing protein n=1 Tax=Flavobacterium magnum TaxID=2162713 RepID=A0A2S0RJI0_9FLAO|nr:hypothetical protein [Flavobacterium magnum]AWA30872.1 hypothetical protein HYN48_12725 [Flavobacterium magnum]
MKKTYPYLAALLLCSFFSIGSHAQSNVKELVIGCWKIDSVNSPETGAQMDLPDGASSIVCLKKDGRFTTTTGSMTVEGDYKISEDGKTMTQSMDGGMQDEGEISVTDTALEIKTSEVIIKLKRIKE